MLDEMLVICLQASSNSSKGDSQKKNKNHQRVCTLLQESGGSASCPYHTVSTNHTQYSTFLFYMKLVNIRYLTANAGN